MCNTLDPTCPRYRWSIPHPLFSSVGAHCFPFAVELPGSSNGDPCAIEVDASSDARLKPPRDFVASSVPIVCLLHPTDHIRGSPQVEFDETFPRIYLKKPREKFSTAL